MEVRRIYYNLIYRTKILQPSDLNSNVFNFLILNRINVIGWIVFIRATVLMHVWSHFIILFENLRFSDWLRLFYIISIKMNRRIIYLCTVIAIIAHWFTIREVSSSVGCSFQILSFLWLVYIWLDRYKAILD